MALQDFIPKVRAIPIISSVERIFQTATDFIRGNPIVSTASIGAGVTGIAAITAVVAARRKKKKAKRKKRVSRRRAKRRKRVHRVSRVHVHRIKHRHRRKHVSHRSPRHRGHKRVSFTTKDGKRVNFLVRKK